MDGVVIDAEARAERDEEICRLYCDGETQSRLGRMYGLSTQRISQIVVGEHRFCLSCGEESDRSPLLHCTACCSCSCCGKWLDHRGHGRDLLCVACMPRKGAGKRRTMRSVEPGIYRVFYPETGYWDPSFLVGESGQKNSRFRRFKTLEEARAFKAQREKQKERECDTCGRTFTPLRSTGRYCSRACRKVGRLAYQAARKEWKREYDAKYYAEMKADPERWAAYLERVRERYARRQAEKLAAAS